MIIDWQDLSRKCLPHARKRLTSCESVLAGFDLLVDRIKRLDTHELERLIRDIGTLELEELLVPKSSVIPQHTPIRDQRGLVELLVKCIASGDSMEVPISALEVFQWLNDIWTESSDLKVGGQAAFMALAACTLVPKIILVGGPIPRSFATLLPNRDNIFIVASDDDEMHVKPVSECTGLAGHDYANWALEFSAGLEVCVGSAKLESRRAGKVIANWFPRHEWMSRGTSERLHSSDIKVTHAFLSGCQLLCPTVQAEGSWRRQISEFANAIDALHSKAACRAIHYEMGSVQSLPLLGAMIDDVLPRADSVGCNEVELIEILQGLGEKELVWEIRSTISPANVYRGALRLMQRFGLGRLHVHTWDFHVSVSRLDTQRADVERDALLFGTVMGAAKTYAPLEIQDEHIEKGFEVPFSETGKRLVERLHKDPKGMGVRIGDGTFQTDDALVCVVPGRVKPGLASTVGLGDTLSSTAFLAATG